MASDPNCTRCPLHQGVKSVCIASEGPARARLLVVGEGPGYDEDQQGRPFVGASGKLLRAALTNLGVEHRIANTVRCRPPDNRKPLAAEVQACRPYLEADLAEMTNLEVVVLLGETAFRAWGLKGSFMERTGVPIDGQTLGSLRVEHRGPEEVPRGQVLRTPTQALQVEEPRHPARDQEGAQDPGGSSPPSLEAVVREGGDQAPGERPLLERSRRPNLRGRLDHQLKGLFVLVPMAHPAYVLRRQDYLGTWQSHWDVVRGLLTRGDDPAAKIGAVFLDHVELDEPGEWISGQL